MSIIREYGPEDMVMIPDNGPIGLCISELEEARSLYGIAFREAQTVFDYYDGYEMEEVIFASEKYEIEIGFSNLHNSDFTHSVTLKICMVTGGGKIEVDLLKHLDAGLTELYLRGSRKIGRYSDLCKAMKNAASIAGKVVTKLETGS